MATQPETNFQQRVQKLIRSRGGYCKKNWGSMVSAPGVSDITVCYKGLYITLECKIEGNKPSPAQGVHARNVNKAGGLTAVVWTIKEVELILDIIDELIAQYKVDTIIDCIKGLMKVAQIDDCTRY